MCIYVCTQAEYTMIDGLGDTMEMKEQAEERKALNNSYLHTYSHTHI